MHLDRAGTDDFTTENTHVGSIITDVLALPVSDHLNLDPRRRRNECGHLDVESLGNGARRPPPCSPSSTIGRPASRPTTTRGTT